MHSQALPSWDIADKVTRDTQAERPLPNDVQLGCRVVGRRRCPSWVVSQTHPPAGTSGGRSSKVNQLDTLLIQISYAVENEINRVKAINRMAPLPSPTPNICDIGRGSYCRASTSESVLSIRQAIIAFRTDTMVSALGLHPQGQRHDPNAVTEIRE
jgi:hypothetical protein